jgi:predicted Zn-ribbon and HTH transcriptional regulator
VECQLTTQRQQIIEIISQNPATVRQLAEALHLRMADVVEHLNHVQRSLKKTLAIGPAVCLHCGFTLTQRRKFTAPSRCPLCKSENTSEPLISIKREHG